MPTVTEVFRIYAGLYDESAEIAEDHQLDFAHYAGQAATLLNRMNGFRIRPAQTKLIAGERKIPVPPLASFENVRIDDLEDYVDVIFSSRTELERFVFRARECDISKHERMNRALRLANFVIINTDDWQSPIFE